MIQKITQNNWNFWTVNHRRNDHGDRGDRSPQLLRPWDHRWIGPSQILGPVRQCNVHIIGGKWIHSDVSAADQFTCSRIGITWCFQLLGILRNRPVRMHQNVTFALNIYKNFLRRGMCSLPRPHPRWEGDLLPATPFPPHGLRLLVPPTLKTWLRPCRQPYYASKKIVNQSSDFPVRRTGSYHHKKALTTSETGVCNNHTCNNSSDNVILEKASHLVT